MIVRILFFTCQFVFINALYEGDSCQIDGIEGICVNIKNCPSALRELQLKKRPQICAFQGSDSIVCCRDKTSQPSLVTTTKKPGSPNTEDSVEEYDYDDTDRFGGGCEPIPKTQTSSKTGQKAWDKCIDYQDSYVYPCKPSVALTGGMTRANLCHHNADELIVGGVTATPHEFPHMAIIGFGEMPDIIWQCGGSIISESFILSAAHCIADRKGNKPTHAAVGIDSRSQINISDYTKVFKIKRIVTHPGYKPPVKYNDIVLFELDTPIKLDHYTVPACLDVGGLKNDQMASTSGWGLTEHRGKTTSETLQKVIVSKFPIDQCKLSYPISNKMPRGVDSGTQLCYGDQNLPKDTCEGDSGGPLQIKSQAVNCMYIIIGVTSTGKGCGFPGLPGLYTRVAPYLPWIESVVWP